MWSQRRCCGFALTSKYGFSGYGWIAWYYDQWVWPTAIFLAISVIAGLVCLVVVRGWRWFGAGLVAGAVVLGVLDLAWSLVYLTLIEGS
jgi:hypothetical protein